MILFCAEVEKGAKRGAVARTEEVGCRRDSTEADRRACTEKLVAGVALEASKS